MPPPIVGLTREMLTAPVTVNLERKAAPAIGITHAVYPVAQELKSALVYVAVGWSGVAALPKLESHLGLGPTALLALGGALYSAGAAVHALRRPNLAPGVFGYHEMFHAPVILTAVTPLRVIAVYVPRARDEGSVQATIRSTFRPEEEEWLRR